MPTVAAHGELMSIVDADDELAALLDRGAREQARRDALARVRRLSPGVWDAGRRSSPRSTTGASW